MEIEKDSPVLREDDSASQSQVERVRNWYRGLPDKKRYLELITAFLSIPVLVTVLLSNVTSLRGREEPTPTPSPSAPITVYVSPKDENPSGRSNVLPITTSPTTTPSGPCTPGIGPIEIAYPRENETVNSDPVYVDITRHTGSYCSVVWSWRINNGPWSEFSDRSISLYGLTPGQKQLELKIKSIVTTEERTLKSTFTVGGPTPTQPTSTQSGTLNDTGTI